jgi:AcrR family transcriptional regulator
LIDEEGLAHLTTREVARRAGVSEASIFYHFEDKVGLLQEVMVSGLGPLRELDVDLLERRTDEPVEDMLTELAVELERYLARVLPVVETVQADGILRVEFAKRIAKQGLGPRRGVELVARHLLSMQRTGRVNQQADPECVGLMLVGACFVRLWYQRLVGPRYKTGMPELTEVADALGQLLAP